MRILLAATTQKSKKALLSTTALIAASAMLWPTAASAQVDDNADWDNVTITHGSGSVTDTGLGSTTIDQHSMRAIGEADRLDIGKNGNVTINQISKDALFVGRAIGKNADPTQILGKLSADGRVMVIDRNGVFFGPGSRVDVAGITVSTGDVSNDEIMSGSEKMTFENFGDGEIVLEGAINVSDAGLAAFVSPTVKNSGVINAKMGNVVMASGEKVTLDMYGDGLVEVAVEGDLGKTLIENKGRIEAEGGKIQLTTQAAKDVVDSVVNNEGIISASSASVQGGKIILSGAIDTSAAPAGKISVTGNDIEITQTGSLKNGDAGDTYVYGNEKTDFKGTLEAGKNSTSEISGHELVLGGTIKAGEGSSISFDPATLTVGAGEAATFVSALNNNGVTVNVEAQDKITVNSDIDSSAQGTNSTLHFKDENANNDLEVDLNAKIKLGASQNLTGEATKVNVASTGSIQNGVKVSKAGATVNVAAGTYNESVTVDRALTLNGANAGVNGNGARGGESKIVATSPGILVTANNVTVDGFEIEGGNVGIEVKNANNAVLKNNKIHGQFHPSAEGASFGGLATGDGIYVENSDGTLIERNLIENYNDDGVHVRNVSNVTIADNVIHDNGNGDQGIAVALGSGTTTIANNTVTNARRDGIQVLDTTTGATTVTGNTITGFGNSGIDLGNVRNASVDNNTISGPGLYGVNVYNSRDVVVGDEDANNNSGNTISNAKIGVKVSGSTFTTVQDNTITGSETGIDVNDSQRVLLQANNVAASGNGIRFWNGINDDKRILVYDNQVDAGGHGILIEGGISNGSIVNLGAMGLGNTIVAGKDGVRVEGVISGSRLRISDSDITGTDDGIEIDTIGDDAVTSVWYNTSVIGQRGSGVEVSHINSATAGGGLAIVGNYNIEGRVHDGVTVKDINAANVIIVDNDQIKGQRHGVNFAGTVSNANILIGEDGLDGVDSVITATVGDGIHFDRPVGNSMITVGAGTLAVNSLTAASTYTGTAAKGITINSGNDGIGFERSVTNSDLFFLGNDINSGDNGMEFLGVLADTDVTIAGNTIDAGNDAVDFDNSITNGKIVVGSALGYAGNITTSLQSGVEFGKMGISTIANVVVDIVNNTINAGVHGVAVDFDLNDAQFTITGNDITGTQRGISVANGDLKNGTTFNISNNDRIQGTARDGILIQDLSLGGASVTISGNGDPVLLTAGITGGDDGVDLRNIETATISNNYIHDTTHDGMNILGGTSVDISGNTIERADGHGIDMRDVAVATITDNTLEGNGISGIYLRDDADVTLDNNTIAANILYGLHADGTGNGSIKLTNNVFLDNPTGARFESGIIDVSDILNPNTFDVMGGLLLPTYVGMQFDGAPTVLTIAGETLGGTIFNGYGAFIPGTAYYVRFEDGSILNPVTNEPILIDGQFASWDGVVPDVFGAGFPSSAERQFIEDRLYDADDAVVNGRGQIFEDAAGPGPGPGPDTDGDLGNIQDFFREFETPSEQANRASVRVLGLPPIGVIGTAFNLNNIAPNAGDPLPTGTMAESLAALSPAAGEEAAVEASAVEPAAGQATIDPAAIEPEAGGQEATCWGDALNSLDQGAVTYNFGGTFEESLVGESRCATTVGAAGAGGA